MHGIEIFQFIKLSREVFDLKPVSCEGHGGFKLLDLELEKLRHVRVLTSIIKASIYCRAQLVTDAEWEIQAKSLQSEGGVHCPQQDWSLYRVTLRSEPLTPAFFLCS